MLPGEEDLLDAVAFSRMQPNRYYRVHPHAVAGTVIDPLAPNPFSMARLALPPAVAPGGRQMGMFYAANTPAGALFEALLRRATIYEGRQVYQSRSTLTGQCVSVVRLLSPVELLALGLPDRKLIVVDAQRDARWRELITTADHGDTHVAAAAVAAQVAAAGRVHSGLSWPSLQFPTSTVYLLYDPPFERDAWMVEETIALDTPAGEAFITQALADAGYAWLADAAGGAYGPGPDDAGVL